MSRGRTTLGESSRCAHTLGRHHAKDGCLICIQQTQTLLPQPLPKQHGLHATPKQQPALLHSVARAGAPFTCFAEQPTMQYRRQTCQTYSCQGFCEGSESCLPPQHDGWRRPIASSEDDFLLKSPRILCAPPPLLLFSSFARGRRQWSHRKCDDAGLKCSFGVISSILLRRAGGGKSSPRETR